jgi:4-hydroxybenzoate polyprenyltransferase
MRTGPEQLWFVFLTAAILLLLVEVTPVHAFSARLSRPWDGSLKSRRTVTFLRLAIAELSTKAEATASTSSSSNEGTKDSSAAAEVDQVVNKKEQEEDENEDDEDTEVLSLKDTERLPPSSSASSRRYASSSSSRQVVFHVASTTKMAMPKTIITRSTSASLTQLQAVTSSSNNNNGSEIEIFPPPRPELEDPVVSAGIAEPNGATKSTSSAIATPTPSVRSCLKELIQMSRPVNDPVVVLLHMLGVYLALQSSSGVVTSLLFWKFIASPSMMVVLVALVLTSSTSMLVNDYYDYKLGMDQLKTKATALTSQKVPLLVVKRFVSYLYAAALVSVTMIPGAPARLSVVGGLMLTFWYTQHLKPRTWLKNVVCASLIALSPLTSGMSALAMLSSSALSAAGPFTTTTAAAPVMMTVTSMAPLLRVVGMLFLGILGREMTMDINDLDDDKAHGVRTVPVKYGRKFASRMAFGCTVAAASLALSGPALQVLQVLRSSASQPALAATALVAGTPGLIRRCAMASGGGFLQVRRATQVLQSEGQDFALNRRAVNEGLLTVVLLLASFV